MLCLRNIFVALLLSMLGSRAADLPSSGLRAAAAYSLGHTGTGLLVQQHGKTLFSNDPGSAYKIYSGTKGFWVLAALHAVQAGLINLDDRVAETLPEWQADARKSRVTVRQLISFTSGLEPLFGLHENSFADRNHAALQAQIVAEPGTRFIYGPAALQVFEEYFKRKLAAHGESPTHYLEKNVLKPMGLGKQRYLEDKLGNPLVATGFMMNTSQWLREGELILRGGKPVVTSRALDECFHGSAANRCFGIGFWNNEAAGTGGREVDVEGQLNHKWYEQEWSGACLCREAPSDLVVAVGSGYQRLYVIPSMELVVVRFGNFGKFSDGTFLRLLLGK